MADGPIDADVGPELSLSVRVHSAAPVVAHPLYVSQSGRNHGVMRIDATARPDEAIVSPEPIHSHTRLFDAKPKVAFIKPRSFECLLERSVERILQVETLGGEKPGIVFRAHGFRGIGCLAQSEHAERVEIVHVHSLARLHNLHRTRFEQSITRILGVFDLGHVFATGIDDPQGPAADVRISCLFHPGTVAAELVVLHQGPNVLPLRIPLAGPGVPQAVLHHSQLEWFAVKRDGTLGNVLDILAEDAEQPLRAIVHPGQILGIDHVGQVPISMVEIVERAAGVVRKTLAKVHVEDCPGSEP